MTRGRSIDKTIPPSRALAQQRDYRARKAARIESLESEVSQLRAENDALRTQLRNIQQGTARGDDRLGRSVVDIRQHLLKALDAVNSLDGGTPSHSPNSTISTSTPSSTTAIYVPEAHRPIPSKSYSSNLPPIIHENLKPSQEQFNSPIHYPSPIPPHTHQPTPKIIEPPYDPTCCGGLLDCSDSLPPLQLPITDPRQSAPPPSHQTGGPDLAYDEDCCAGVFDCSDIPLVDDGMAVDDGDRRGISHCRVER